MSEGGRGGRPAGGIFLVEQWGVFVFWFSSASIYCLKWAQAVVDSPNEPTMFLLSSAIVLCGVAKFLHVSLVLFRAGRAQRFGAVKDESTLLLYSVQFYVLYSGCVRVRTTTTFLFVLKNIIQSTLPVVYCTCTASHSRSKTVKYLSCTIMTTAYRPRNRRIKTVNLKQLK